MLHVRSRREKNRQIKAKQREDEGYRAKEKLKRKETAERLRSSYYNHLMSKEGMPEDQKLGLDRCVLSGLCRMPAGLCS